MTKKELEAEVKRLREIDGRWLKMCTALTDELMVAGAKLARVRALADEWTPTPGVDADTFGYAAERIYAALGPDQ